MDMRTETNIIYPERYYGNTSFRTAGESEGSGSSGRIDPEIAASEVSSTPMRRCVSFNSENCDALQVPTQVLPLTNLMQSEKKDLVCRLKTELEQIQSLRKKVELLRTNSFTVSSSSDILSCSNVRNGPSSEFIKNTSNLTSGQRKKSNVPSLNKGQGSRQVSSGRVVSTVQTVQASASNATNATSAILMKQCDQLLKRVMSHQYAWVFNTPVDTVKLNLSDYFTIIKHPMDLGTVKSKLASGVYSSPLDFLADVRLTFSNAMTYNPPGNDVHIMAEVLNSYFDTRWKAIEKKLPKTDGHALPTKSRPREEVETVKRMPQKKMKVSSRPQEVTPLPTKHVMTDEEKLNLGRELESLLGDLPMHIIDFLREYSSGGSGDEDFEVDIDDLSDDALFKLRKLLDDHFRGKQKNNISAEPCVIELQMLNDSGVSNSSMQPSKGSEPIDEDVNAGGPEAPVSSCAPLEIEKDAAIHRNSKCTSSRNPNDLNSSYSEKDSEHDKSSIQVHEQTLETIDSEGPVVEPTTSDGPLERNQSKGGYEQLEQTSGKPSSTESDCNQDGNSIASEKQVSPGRLYRAALLKNRFADTILRAKEKTMTQGEKCDPEKLRREREELELEQRKEKARLQAEAKAAQDAQRRVEAEAAAEAKRKRELEREAARQALLQMEKTVMIDENSQILEDLEMLRAARTEQLPSSVDESSPDHSQDCLGGFNFVGSNPLEQLGLFIKADEEDEEIEPNFISNSIKDVEEGENSIKDVEEGEID